METYRYRPLAGISLDALKVMEANTSLSICNQPAADANRSPPETWKNRVQQPAPFTRDRQNQTTYAGQNFPSFVKMGTATAQIRDW
ncbi:hypothetical protein MTX26_26695 [Bradyrhizobium sp. ISRA443]|uniref:hypothetical protein n=1 Tax=unclassified Bradyrhizobium TaxID=2631580 RepID=UPI0024796D8B|nr:MULTISPECIES: hypothetical protein [unclassified Bradyrhizobium]WGR93384.1 hypothetical protein MTX20_37765 [Bradyrhizobium sp. ISRA435]WGR97920.1 hypothetical protein MTX23_26690 [Bradyrhizobium sp. ISRA436]WGS04810.1 hypothetical protein MTX18_26700 [Bradyrhizobium sp. ISRA437]WGS11690.1 hypothetical protein MTX26_26695 [Bradyrhizobium sp. ISRA443]